MLTSSENLFKSLLFPAKKKIHHNYGNDLYQTMELSFHKLPLLTFKLTAIYFTPQILPLANVVESCDLQTH